MGDRFDNQHLYSSDNCTKKTYSSGYKGKRGTKYDFNKKYTEHDGHVSQGFKKNLNSSESRCYEDYSYNMRGINSYNVPDAAHTPETGEPTDGRWKHETAKRNVGNNFKRKYENRGHKEDYYGTKTKQWDKTESTQTNSTADTFNNWNDFLLSIPPPEIDWDKINKEYEEEKKQKFSGCPQILRDFYKEHPDIRTMSESEVTRFRNTYKISVSYMFDCKSWEIPKPVFTFEQAFHCFPELLNEVRKQKFEKPSPIQSQGWPVLLRGNNLIGIAQTGTGKTLAFLLPAFIHIDKQPVPISERGGPNVIILAPTRELVQQIEKEAKKYHYKNIKCVSVYGGTSKDDQVTKISEGAQIIVATPGRLNEIVSDGILQLKSVTYLVLDEADRMLDMGFEPQIRSIISEIRPDRQTVMTSATWPDGIKELAKSYMDNPVQVHIGSLNLAAVHTVTQIVDIVQESEKNGKLMDFCLKMNKDDKAIVFVGKKIKVDEIEWKMRSSDMLCSSIHGDREQWERDMALNDFKTGKTQILLATDVASRGIDIDDITHILNYDFPRNIEEYVHRIGRTGRAGRSGQAVSYFTEQDMRHAKELIDILKESKQMIPEELYGFATEYESKRQERDENASERRNFYRRRMTNCRN